jgi:hypothetical protein
VPAALNPKAQPPTCAHVQQKLHRALFNYHLALLTFEAAKVAPVSGLSTGSSTTSSSSTSTR